MINNSSNSINNANNSSIHNTNNINNNNNMDKLYLNMMLINTNNKHNPTYHKYN